MLLFDAPWPDSLKQLYQFFVSFNIDILRFAPMSCAGVPLNFYAQFVIMVACAAAVFLFLWREYFWVILTGNRGRRAKRLSDKVGEDEDDDENSIEAIRAFCLRDSFIIMLLVHPTISGEAFKFFRCETIEGTNYLVR